jgi:hypothetical protein
VPSYTRQYGRLFGLLLAGAWALDGCGGGGSSPPPAPSSFTIGGTASGLASGGQVVLLDNGGDTLTVTADGTFTFPTPLQNAAAYAVTVKTAPAGEICTVGSGSGTVASAAITNVTVTCADSYTIGGLVNGLSKGQQVVLLDNGGDSLTVTAYSSDSPAVVVEPNSAFSFTTALVSAAAYSVTVDTAPAGDTCAVSNGSGTVATANVTNVIVTCGPTPISGSKVLLELGHAQDVANLQVTTTSLLSQDQSGHWALWNLATDALIANGNATCLSSQCSKSSSAVGAVALAGQTLVIETAGGLEIGSATDGRVAATIPGPISWWTLASDGSYAVTGSPTALQAWSPTGQHLYSLAGNYASAIAFAAPGQIQVALSPAGANVIQTIAASTGAATTGPAFLGTFNEWFADGSHFQTLVGSAVYTYLNTSLQADVTSLSTVYGLGGQGNWFWNQDQVPMNVNVYKVGSSGTPAATYSGGNPTTSGTTLAVQAQNGLPQFTLVDLSGTALTSTVQALPGFPESAYAAISPTEWFIGNAAGAIFDGASSVASPKYLALGAAMSIAGGGGSVAIATGSGQIYVINPQSAVVQNTIGFVSGNLQMSTDGTVLAALSTIAVSPPVLQVYSLPSGTVMNSFGGSGSANIVLGYSLAGSGTVIAQLTGPTLNANLQQVTDLATSTVIWSSSTFVTTPVLFSPDGTLFAAPTQPYAYSVNLATSANIYLNGQLSAVVGNSPVGWIDNGRLLVDNFAPTPGGTPLYQYSGSTIYGPTGTVLASPALPALSSIQTVTADTVYSPEYDAIYSLTTGAATWNGTPPPTTNSPVGAIAGAYAVVVFGTQVVAEPY